MAELPFVDPWHCPHSSSKSNSRSLYICISGNSGSGKSTLLRLLGIYFQKQLGNTIAIDETSLHHPFIDRLFFTPQLFSFEIQLNFMLQRCLLAKRWLSEGHHVVMERSHPEDIIFIQHLYSQNLVTERERDAYIELWKAMSERLSPPDLIVFFNLPAGSALERLNRAEESGARPREFPNETAKRNWLTSWQALYQKRFEEIQSDNLLPNTKIVALSGEEEEGEIPSLVQQALDSLIERLPNLREEK